MAQSGVVPVKGKTECPLQEGEGTHDEWYKEFVHLEFILTSTFQ